MDSAFLEKLLRIVGPEGLLVQPGDLRTYECDGLTNFRVLPGAVVLPSRGEQVPQILAACHEHKVPFVARGSGTGLSGGALPVKNGIVIGLTKLIPEAKKREVVLQANIVGVGVIEARRTSGSVLVYLNQSSTDKASRDPVYNGSRIRVDPALQTYTGRN